MNVKAPESVTIAVSEDGENFKEVEFTHNDYQVNQKSELVFNEVQKAKALRFTMKQVGTGYVGLTELEIWTSEKGYTSNKTAELEELKVDGTAVEGFRQPRPDENARSAQRQTGHGWLLPGSLGGVGIT